MKRRLLCHVMRPRRDRGVALSILGSFLFSLQVVTAHEGDFLISRDDAARPRLCVNGQSNLLSDGECVELLKGQGVFEGYWFNDAPGFATLKHDNDIRGRRRLLPGHRLAVRLVRADPGFALVSPHDWKPVLSRSGETYRFFSDAQGDFTIQMLCRVATPGRCRVTLQMTDLAGLHRDSEPFTFCLFGVLAPPQPTTRPADPPDRARGGASPPRLMPSSNPALAESPGHSHAAARPFRRSSTFRGAVEDLRARLHAVANLLAAKKLSDAVPDALALKSLIEDLPRLIRAGDSTVPLPERDPLCKKAAALLGPCDGLRFATYYADPVGAPEHHAALGAFLDACEKFIPARYVCPMRCENEKTYPAPGKCPECGMSLADTRAHLDHSPKHGGTFFMAPDNQHHLEGALEPNGEFRLYIYDEFTRPISAERIAAKLVIRKADPADEQPSDMRSAEGGAFLQAQVPTIAAVRLKLFVDFRDGADPQVFDFEFIRAANRYNPAP